MSTHILALLREKITSTTKTQNKLKILNFARDFLFYHTFKKTNPAAVDEVFLQAFLDDNQPVVKTGVEALADILKLCSKKQA